jgi:hypothetical protein
LRAAKNALQKAIRDRKGRCGCAAQAHLRARRSHPEGARDEALGASFGLALVGYLAP